MSSELLQQMPEVPHQIQASKDVTPAKVESEVKESTSSALASFKAELESTKDGHLKVGIDASLPEVGNVPDTNSVMRVSNAQLETARSAGIAAFGSSLEQSRKAAEVAIGVGVLATQQEVAKAQAAAGAAVAAGETVYQGAKTAVDLHNTAVNTGAGIGLKAAEIGLGVGVLAAQKTAADVQAAAGLAASAGEKVFQGAKAAVDVHNAVVNTGVGLGIGAAVEAKKAYDGAEKAVVNTGIDLAAGAVGLAGGAIKGLGETLTGAGKSVEAASSPVAETKKKGIVGTVAGWLGF